MPTASEHETEYQTGYEAAFHPLYPQAEPVPLFWFISTPQLLLYENRFFIEQRLDDRKNILDAAVLLQFSDALLRIYGKQIQNLLTFRQAHPLQNQDYILRSFHSPVSGRREVPLYRHRLVYRDNNQLSTPKT